MKKAFLLYSLVTVLIVSCDKDTTASSSSATSNTGVAGSLSRFTIIGNYMYAVSRHYLYTIDITDPAHPAQVKQTDFNYDMETIFPYKNYLFIGSTTGIYIYSLATPAAPALMGTAKHGRSCDPVIANDTASYSTLRSGSSCGPAISGLYVYDVRDINLPIIKDTVLLHEPIGLAMADTALYVCCGSEGLKVFSIKNAYTPVEKQTINGGNFTDVIVYNNILICWVSDGISLYDIGNRFSPVFIKKIDN